MSHGSIAAFAASVLIVFAVLFWMMRERAWYILLSMVFMFLTMMLVVLVLVRLEW